MWVPNSIGTPTEHNIFVTDFQMHGGIIVSQGIKTNLQTWDSKLKAEDYKIISSPNGVFAQKGLGSTFLYANRQRGREWTSGHRKLRKR